MTVVIKLLAMEDSLMGRRRRCPLRTGTGSADAHRATSQTCGPERQRRVGPPHSPAADVDDARPPRPRTTLDEAATALPVAARAITERCAAVKPRLAKAPVVASRVGVRPTRSEGRVEADSRSDGVPVLHNYGHGGSGVTPSWGCAQEIVELVTATG
ncbi:FAD-dependent oxidoreductase [Streptomyces sp. NPDC051677]|uniref:FAD-dependent oxidoreductase n=1 Tax=Streptomyces sp. NPDC051677 TaxID=3365669 RepID=UPI0037CFB5A9